MPRPLLRVGDGSFFTPPVEINDLFLTGEEIRRLVVEGGLVEGYVDLGAQVQPNGFDLTVGKIELVEPTGGGAIGFADRAFPGRRPIDWSQDGSIDLRPGDFYVGWTNETVSMPLDTIGILKPRTSAFTMGLVVLTGIVDAGFRGHIRFGLMACRPVKVGKNARLVHMTLARLSTETKGYGGDLEGAFPSLGR